MVYACPLGKSACNISIGFQSQKSALVDGLNISNNRILLNNHDNLITSMSFVNARRIVMRLVDYVVSFFAVKSSCKLIFERKEPGLSKRTADIIRLIGPEEVLQS